MEYSGNFYLCQSLIGPKDTRLEHDSNLTWKFGLWQMVRRCWCKTSIYCENLQHSLVNNSVGYTLFTCALRLLHSISLFFSCHPANSSLLSIPYHHPFHCRLITSIIPNIPYYCAVTATFIVEPPGDHCWSYLDSIASILKVRLLCFVRMLCDCLLSRNLNLACLSVIARFKFRSVHISNSLVLLAGFIVSSWLA